MLSLAGKEFRIEHSSHESVLSITFFALLLKIYPDDPSSEKASVRVSHVVTHVHVPLGDGR